MPTNRKRISVSPDEKALVFLGLDPCLKGDVSSAALSGAIDRYADLIQEVSGELAKVCARRAVWEMIADVMRPTRFPAEADELPAHVQIAHELDRAHTARQIGERWLLYPNEKTSLTHEAAAKRATERVRGVCDGIRGLTSVHGAVVLAGVRWYWTHRHEMADATGDWWLPRERWKWFEAREKAAREKASREEKAQREETQLLLFEEPEEQRGAG